VFHTGWLRHDRRIAALVLPLSLIALSCADDVPPEDPGTMVPAVMAEPGSGTTSHASKSGSSAAAAGTSAANNMNHGATSGSSAGSGAGRGGAGGSGGMGGAAGGGGTKAGAGGGSPQTAGGAGGASGAGGGGAGGVGGKGGTGGAGHGAGGVGGARITDSAGRGAGGHGGAGMGGAGMAGKGAGSGAAGDSCASKPPAERLACENPKCAACEQASTGATAESCSAAMKSCLQWPHPGDTGSTATAIADWPAADGVHKDKLCTDVVSCVRRTGCAASFNATDCLCGIGADPNTCFSGTLEGAKGPCKDEIVAASGSYNKPPLMSDLAQHFSDPTFPIGAADAVFETCDYLLTPDCISVCLGGPGAGGGTAGNASAGSAGSAGAAGTASAGSSGRGAAGGGGQSANTAGHNG
jgi:hypothetical protein